MSTSYKAGSLTHRHRVAMGTGVRSARISLIWAGGGTAGRLTFWRSFLAAIVSGFGAYSYIKVTVNTRPPVGWQ